MDKIFLSETWYNSYELERSHSRLNRFISMAKCWLAKKGSTIYMLESRKKEDRTDTLPVVEEILSPSHKKGI